MQHLTTQILFSYWNEARQDRAAPHRFDIEPARLSHILPEAMILEYRHDGEYYFRLAGTRICEQFGVEFRATRFIDFWSWSDRHQIARHLDPIRLSSKVSILSFEAVSEMANVATFEMLLLPLTLDGKTNDRFLGCIASTSQDTWLGHERVVDVQLLAAHTHEARELAELIPRNPIAPPSAHPRHQAAPANIKGHARRRFRVIEGGLSSKHPAGRT